eukprot:15361989-Ditylum_brightwellii.AAC.2
MPCIHLLEKVMRTLMVESYSVHSSWRLRCQKGDENCHGRSMSSSFQTINSQTREFKLDQKKVERWRDL